MGLLPPGAGACVRAVAPDSAAATARVVIEVAAAGRGRSWRALPSIATPGTSWVPSAAPKPATHKRLVLIRGSGEKKSAGNLLGFPAS